MEQGRREETSSSSRHSLLGDHQHKGEDGKWGNEEREKTGRKGARRR